VLPASPGAPAPSSALRLLHQLAADPAIAAVMEAHGWRVGLLSEMPPEGKVGISMVRRWDWQAARPREDCCHEHKERRMEQLPGRLQ
jgi:hypothetical protein